MCAAMKWNHLPVAGGLYDQHPQLLEEWAEIFRAQADKEERDQRERDRKSKAGSSARGGRGRRR